MQFFNIISFCLLCTFLCCCKEEPCVVKNTYYELKYDDTTCIPYDGSDSIWFEISDSGGNITDTCLFVSDGKRDTAEFKEQSTAWGEDCPENIYSICRYIVFKSVSFPDSITVKIKPHQNGAWVFVVFKGSPWVVTAYEILHPSSGSSGNIMIGGNMYSDFYYPYGSLYPIFMHKNHGIIRLVTPYNTTLSLIKK